MTLAPTQNPTTIPSARPTVSETFSPTAFTPKPLPFNQVAASVVCGTEIFLTDDVRRFYDLRQLQEGQNTPYTTENCFATCKALLSDSSNLYFNLYFENGVYHCTCCLDCVDPRFLASAQVYETCTVTKDVTLKAKLNRKHVLPGMKLQYAVVIKRLQDENKGKGRHLLQRNQSATLEGLGVRITLPEGVVYTKTKTFPPFLTKGEGGRRRKNIGQILTQLRSWKEAGQP